jgi:hypothetical protein
LDLRPIDINDAEQVGWLGAPVRPR